jgi:hypothetical protein
MKFDALDDGMHTNFRDVDGEYLGIRCGCYGDACMTDSALDDYTNAVNKGMELEFAHQWAAKVRLAFVARYMGGMTDPGRGGYWGGPDERDGMQGSYGAVDCGDPAVVVKAWQAQNPGAQFVLSHDESGQFQTYWSLWRVVDEDDEAVAPARAAG